MPKKDLVELSNVRNRYFKNFVSCVSSAAACLDNEDSVSAFEQFGFASWYFEQIKQLDFRIGCASVDSENFPEK